MSGSTYVVVPVQADSAEGSEAETAKIAASIRQSRSDNKNAQEHKNEESIGPFKQIIAHQDSLYRYISWEDPIRTLGSYIVVLSILLGTHYLPLTRLAVKAGAATFGVISFTEFVNRLFGPKTFFAHLRPQEYKKIPESTLNATLKDIHDFVQYFVIRFQRIIFAHDLDKTFATFIGFTALYWLIKFVTPFWLTVFGFTSLYIVPLITSPRGREVANDTMSHAGQLASTATEKGKVFAQQSREKATDLSSKGGETAIKFQQQLKDLGQSGKQTVADLPTQARNTVSDVSGTTAENVKRFSTMAADSISKAPVTLKSILGDSNQSSTTHHPSAMDETYNNNHIVMDGATTKPPQQVSFASDTTN